MVTVFTVPYINMQGDATVNNHGPEKLLHKLGVKGSYFFCGKGAVKDKIGPVAIINGYIAEGLLHGNDLEPIAIYAL